MKSSSSTVADIAVISIKCYANYSKLIEILHNSIVQVTDISHTLIPGILLGIYEKLDSKNRQPVAADLLTDLNQIISTEFPATIKEIYQTNSDQFKKFTYANPKDVITLLPTQLMGKSLHDKTLNAAGLMANKKLLSDNNSIIAEMSNNFLMSARTLQAGLNIMLLSVGKSLGYLIADNLLTTENLNIDQMNLLRTAVKTITLSSYVITSVNKAYKTSFNLSNMFIGIGLAFLMGGISAYIDNEHYDMHNNMHNCNVQTSDQDLITHNLEIDKKFTKNYQKQIHKTYKYYDNKIVESIVWQRPFKNIANVTKLSILSSSKEDDIINNSIDFLKKIGTHTKAAIEGFNATLFEQAFETGAKFSLDYLQSSIKSTELNTNTVEKRSMAAAIVAKRTKNSSDKESSIRY